MFKYIVIDNGALFQALLAFVLTFSVFLIIMLRAWKMRSSEADHLASLPLDNDSNSESDRETDISTASDTTHTTKS